MQNAVGWRALPFSGELRGLEIEGNGKDSLVRFVASDGRSFALALSGARTRIRAGDSIRVTTHADDDMTLTMRYEPEAGYRMHLTRADVEYPGSEEEWEADYVAWQRPSRWPGGLYATRNLAVDLIARPIAAQARDGTRVLDGRMSGATVVFDQPAPIVDGAAVGVVSFAGLEPHQRLQIREAVDDLFASWDDTVIPAEEFLARLGLPKKDRERERAPVVTQFDRWVAEHQPAAHYEYRPGFWEYVEKVRSLVSKLGIADVRVVGNYVVDTMPPEEKLPMPAVAIYSPHAMVAFKWDFGACCWWPKEWTVSVRRRSPYLGPTFGIFDPTFDLREHDHEGLPSDLVFGPYRANPAEFSCEVEDEWDFAMLLRMVLYEV